MPAEDLAVATELFRHRFLHALREAKLISPKKLSHLLSWKHSGFQIHAAEDQRVRPGDPEGRKRLAEYLLRHPFSLQKITWNATTKTVIYRSKRHHTTKRNFEIFTAADFIAAALLHLPPKGQQTVRYYGIYSNRFRGSTLPTTGSKPAPPAAPAAKDEITGATQILLIPPPPKQAIKEWIPDDEPDLDWFNRPRNPAPIDEESADQRPSWQSEEIRLDDERVLVLDPN